MSLSELYPSVQQLGRADKLRLMQWLVVQLAREDDIPLFSPGAEYSIWTPLNAFDAGETLLQLLNQHKAVTP